MKEHDELRRLVTILRLAPVDVVDRGRRIHELMLATSDYLDAPNFTVIHPDDLERLFGLYDELFFEQRCRRLIAPDRLQFRLSRRMTKAGGKTTRRTYPGGQTGGSSGSRPIGRRSSHAAATTAAEQSRPSGGPESEEYEITVSTTLLFETFADVDRSIRVTGVECRDRLEALQRIFEHELIHLIELLVWNRSSCSQARFQSMASRIFGHTDHRHQLVTPQERALTKFGVQPGSRVRFRFDGRQHVGIVNRVTKRATVLVEDQKGQQYSDGKRYVRFYVPLSMLEVMP